eukprot:gene20980-biopygen15485
MTDYVAFKKPLQTILTFHTVYMMKNKSEVLQKFKEFVALNENLTGRRVKKLRADNGGEYKSDDFEKYCKQKEYYKKIQFPTRHSKMELPSA